MKTKKSTSILMLIISMAIVCLSFGVFSFNFKNKSQTEVNVANAVSSNGGAMYIGAGSKVTLDSSCTITGITGATNGGAIYVAGELTISGATISSCSATYGGAIYIASTGKVIMNSGEISGCTASSGGAIFNAGGTLEIKSGSFEFNSSEGDGGAIYSDGGSLTITGGWFSENSANTSGGAIYSYGVDLTIQGTSSNKVFFGRNETFEEDDIYAGGGAICVYDEDYGDNMSFAEMKYVTFQENRTPSNGGAVNLSFLGGYDYKFSFCDFETNTAVGFGGAISTPGESVGVCDVIINSCTFSSCESSSGGAIFNGSTGTGVITQDRTVFNNCFATNGGGAIAARNITIDDGEFNECTTESGGGAIYGMGSLTINGARDYVRFVDCKADLGGSDMPGGAISWVGGTFEIKSSYFGSCTSYMAGAIYLSSSRGSIHTGVAFSGCSQAENGTINITEDSSVTMYDTDFYGCSSTDGFGGAITVFGTLNIEGGTYFETCYAAYSGGAIANFGSLSFDYSAQNPNCISECSADLSGGGIYVSGSAQASFGQEAFLEILDCTAQSGGGIFFDDRGDICTINLYETTISYCYAGDQDRGGGIYVGESIYLECIYLIVNYCSASMGGGIYSSQNTSLDFSSSNIHNNIGDQSYGANIHFEGGPNANGIIDFWSGTEIYSPIDGYNIFIYDYADVNIRSGAEIGTSNPSTNDRIYGYERDVYVNCYGGIIYSIFDVENANFSFNPTNIITCSSYQTINFSSTSYIQLSDFVCENSSYIPQQSGKIISFIRGTANISINFRNGTEDRVSINLPTGTIQSIDSGGSYSYNGAGGSFTFTCYNFSTNFKIKVYSDKDGILGYIYSNSSAAYGYGSKTFTLTNHDIIEFTMISASATFLPDGVEKIPENNIEEKLFYLPNADEYYDPEKNIQKNSSFMLSSNISDEEKYVVKANRAKIA